MSSKETTKTNKFNMEKLGHGLVLGASGILLIALAVKGSYSILNSNPQIVSRNAYVGAGLVVLMVILVGVYAQKALKK